jgi:hypothetical protein
VLPQDAVCLSVLTEAMPVNGLGYIRNESTSSAALWGGANQLAGKACEIESLRSRGRAQRAAGEWRAPGNMLASASGGGRSVGGRASNGNWGTWGCQQRKHRHRIKRRSPPRHSSCRSVQTGRLGSQREAGRAQQMRGSGPARRKHREGWAEKGPVGRGRPGQAGWEIGGGAAGAAAAGGGPDRDAPAPLAGRSARKRAAGRVG